jgi:hypothetical protein
VESINSFMHVADGAVMMVPENLLACSWWSKWSASWKP